MAERGRPKGSTSKPQFREFVSLKEIEELIALAKHQAAEKPEILKFVLEQYFGRARQNIGLDGGEEEKPISILTVPNGAIHPDNGDKTDSDTSEED